jgi:DNA adenine methylase
MYFVRKCLSATRRTQQLGIELAIYNTPLRYPGGKQKIAPFIAEIIKCNKLEETEYVEPYAGGAGVAIELLVKGVVGSVRLNDSCLSVYSFWKTAVEKPEWLCRKILNSSLTIDEWKKQREIIRNSSEHSFEEVGFATLYLNRCNRSGILSGGVIGGLNQTGKWKMDARFSRQEMIMRIEAIASLRDNIFVTNLDAEEFLGIYALTDSRSSFIYCDPPYVKKADRLYLNHYSLDDHRRIANTIQKLENPYWVVSYDNNELISDIYSKRKKFVYDLQYNARRAYLGSELFIFSDQLLVPDRSTIVPIDRALQLVY